jgi:hypothetical protein
MIFHRVDYVSIPDRSAWDLWWTYWPWDRAVCVFRVFTAIIIRDVAAVLGEHVNLRGPQIEDSKESIAKYFFTLIEPKLFFTIFEVYSREFNSVGVASVLPTVA